MLLEDGHGWLTYKGIMKDEGEIRKVFTDHGVDLNKNTIHSCNSGNTACIVELAWRLAGGV